MKKIARLFSIFILVFLLLSSCAGIKYFTVETQEPAQITFPNRVRSVVVVNNTVKQPRDLGHTVQLLDNVQVQNTEASSDSLAYIFTEALAQFVGEDDFFEEVKFLKTPLRSDNDFGEEAAISPEQMIEVLQAANADAIISLDYLNIETRKREQYRDYNLSYMGLLASVQSVLRIYMPTMSGLLPTTHYSDSLYWEGFEMQDNYTDTDLTLPSTESAMNQLVVYAADKVSGVFSPHWIQQDRWYYLLPDSGMRKGVDFAAINQWQNALNAWTDYYNGEKNLKNRAKAANNISLAYEMMDDLQSALDWAIIAEDGFNKTTPPNSLDRRRAVLLKNEFIRRLDTSNKLNLQLE